MTRQKKSRKIGSIGTRKQEKRPSDTVQQRKKKAPKGQPSGNRNSLVEEKNTVVEGGVRVKKDPKIGSKKKISLIAEKPAPVEKPKAPIKSDLKPAAKLVKSATQQIDPQQELASIESDERLIALAERVEQGEVLSGKDAKYFNKLMDRLDELVSELGLDESDASTEEVDELENLAQMGGSEWDDLLDDEKQ